MGNKASVAVKDANKAHNTLNMHNTNPDIKVHVILFF